MIQTFFYLASIFGPALAPRIASYINKPHGEKQAKRYAALINMSTAIDAAMEASTAAGEAHAEHPSVIEARKRNAEQRAKKDDVLQARVAARLSP